MTPVKKLALKFPIVYLGLLILFGLPPFIFKFEPNGGLDFIFGISSISLLAPGFILLIFLPGFNTENGGLREIVSSILINMPIWYIVGVLYYRSQKK
jgi:hypothetical protein